MKQILSKLSISYETKKFLLVNLANFHYKFGLFKNYLESYFHGPGNPAVPSCANCRCKKLHGRVSVFL